jgi:pimeloyl-ACP methyl ester carboxylesterase
MGRILLLVFQTISLISLASAIAIAQNGQSSRSNTQSEQIVPAADHHQHVFSPAYVEKFLPPGSKSITAQDVIGLLDKAGIRRAVFLANGYSFGRPGSEPPDEYAAVKADNNWAAAQAALLPKRVIAFCGFNPLKEYALDEVCPLCERSQSPPRNQTAFRQFGCADRNSRAFRKIKESFSSGK